MNSPECNSGKARLSEKDPEVGQISVYYIRFGVEIILLLIPRIAFGAIHIEARWAYLSNLFFSGYIIKHA
jgi:hypothetical protein